MKKSTKIAITVLLLIAGLPFLLQAQPTIKLDSAGIKLQIPFNQPFSLKIDTFRGGDIDYIAVYEVEYSKGTGELIDRIHQVSGRPSFKLQSSKDFTRTGPSLKINFPAIRPERDFDVLVSSRFSADHLKMALQINKELYQYRAEPGEQRFLIDHPSIVADFKNLCAVVNQSPYNPKYPTIVFDDDLLVYRKDVYGPVETYYDKIIDNTNLKIPTTFTQAEIDILYISAGRELAVSYHLSSLQNILADSAITQVFNGRLPANYLLPKSETDIFNFDQRIANLNSSLHFVDSLAQCIGLVQSSSADYARIRNGLNLWAADLDSNRVYIKSLSDKITRGILAKSHEAFWLAQTTVSTDLKTRGTRHLTLDVGITNIGATDNQNHYKNLQKLFFGLNFYFISIDKNVDFNKIPKPKPENPKESHTLESRYSVWQRLSLTAGFTLGAMQNKDFDNVYNGLSFTLGPSYRIGKYLKISAGAALLKRFTTNPLETKSNPIVGNYVSLALDYDLLGAVTNLTSLIF